MSCALYYQTKEQEQQDIVKNCSNNECMVQTVSLWTYHVMFASIKFRVARVRVLAPSLFLDTLSLIEVKSRCQKTFQKIDF